MDRRLRRRPRPLDLSVQLLLAMGLGGLIGLYMPCRFSLVVSAAAQGFDSLAVLYLLLWAVTRPLARLGRSPWLTALGRQLSRGLHQAVLPLLPLSLCGLFVRLSWPEGTFSQLWPPLLIQLTALLAARCPTEKASVSP